MKITHLLNPMISLVVLASCSTQQTPAPIVDRGTASRSPDGNRSGALTAPARTVDQPGFHTVRKGDTVLHIAQDFGQNYRDIVTWNNLANANDIRVDQVLRVIPPGTTPGAPQVGSVTTGSGIEARPLGIAPSANSVVAATTSSASLVVINKNGPHGEKRPYSDSSLIELQKPEAQNYTAAATAGAMVGPHSASGSTAITSSQAQGSSAPSPKAQEGKSVDKGAASSEDENVSWTWPTDGKVSAGFDDGKKGIDIAGKSGQQVLAASSGKVMYAGSGIRGYGNLVIVKHTNNLLSAYAHNKVILVKEGQTVTKGQKIAEMGNSDSDGVKLHFEIRQQGKPVDPSKFLPPR